MKKYYEGHKAKEPIELKELLRFININDLYISVRLIEDNISTFAGACIYKNHRLYSVDADNYNIHMLVQNWNMFIGKREALGNAELMLEIEVEDFQ